MTLIVTLFAPIVTTVAALIWAAILAEGAPDTDSPLAARPSRDIRTW
jgi:hypothetical protein